MESLERLFGREITNLGEQELEVKLAAKGRPNARSLSFCGGEPRNLPYRARESINNPNVSQRIHKPKFGKEQEQEAADLRESLTDYFEESLSHMLAQEDSTTQPGNYMPRQPSIS